MPKYLDIPKSSCHPSHGPLEGNANVPEATVTQKWFGYL